MSFWFRFKVEGRGRKIKKLKGKESTAKAWPREFDPSEKEKRKLKKGREKKKEEKKEKEEKWKRDRKKKEGRKRKKERKKEKG